jgi:hypothetical protein
VRGFSVFNAHLGDTKKSGIEKRQIEKDILFFLKAARFFKVATTYSRKESTVFLNAISDIRDTIQKVDAKMDAKNKVFCQKINF